MHQLDARKPKWVMRHYYVFMITTGFAVYFLAGPVASTFQLSPEEYAVASMLSLEGQQYKGRDFLD